MPVTLSQLAMRLNLEALWQRLCYNRAVAIGLPEPCLSIKPALLNRRMRVPKAIQIASLRGRVLGLNLLHQAL
jgi:hypothetical protein